MSFSSFALWMGIGCAALSSLALLVDLLGEARERARERRRSLAVRKWVKAQDEPPAAKRASA